MARAWERWSGLDLTVLRVTRDGGGGDLAGHLARLLHQASFLHCTVKDRATLDWRAASGWLVGALSTYEAGRNRGVEDTDMDIMEWGSGGPHYCDDNGGNERMVPSWSAQ